MDDLIYGHAALDSGFYRGDDVRTDITASTPADMLTDFASPNGPAAILSNEGILQRVTVFAVRSRAQSAFSYKCGPCVCCTQRLCLRSVAWIRRAILIELGWFNIELSDRLPFAKSYQNAGCFFF
jgi:hypothetical protein